MLEIQLTHHYTELVLVVMAAEATGEEPDQLLGQVEP
jgi:hypothetical protein